MLDGSMYISDTGSSVTVDEVYCIWEPGRLSREMGCGQVDGSSTERSDV